MLTLTQISKRFGSVVAVDDLSLEIRPGEVFGLGPSAGKTTTLNIAVGLLKPDGGRVRIGETGDRPTSRTAATRRRRAGAQRSTKS